VPDWSGHDYAEVNSLQRAMVTEAVTALHFGAGDRVLDVGCGDGYLIHTVAGMVPDGYAVGADASPRMIETAHGSGEPTESGPWFVVADARRLPFTAFFDAVLSFNALHWVSEQRQALTQIATVLRPGGRALIQMVCAGPRTSIEATAMTVCQCPRWARWFDGFTAPYVHIDPVTFGELARSAGLTLEDVTVTDREWDFGSREAFIRWCAVGSTAWTDRLPEQLRAAFIADLVQAYEPTAGRQGLFRFTQMRAVLHR
jgi:trans-aconitate 2-methyltransferase